MMNFTSLLKRSCFAPSLFNKAFKTISTEVAYLQLRNNMNKVQHNEVMMKVKEDKLRLLSKEESRKQPIVQNFLFSDDGSEGVKVYEHKNIDVSDPNVNFPRNSFYKVVFPLEKNGQIRDRFTNYFSNALRIGRILEVLDYMATYISYRHCYSDIDKRTVTNVTACVDNMNFYSQLSNDVDLEVQGYVTQVGKSSMEIQLELFQNGDLKASSIFLMVARNTTDKTKSYQVPTLKFEGENNTTKCQIREHLGNKHLLQRKKEKLESLEKRAPSQEEIQEIHSFFVDKKKFQAQQDDNSYTQISSTIFDKNLLMHKQDRNLHGNIFGGHLMREAVEIGWLAAQIHAKGDYPVTFNIDDFQFLTPVPVGSIINFEAKIGYVVKNIMQVAVNCSIVNTNKERVKCNDLHITFVAPNTQNLQKVIPFSYEEAMIYLDSKRRLDRLIS